MTHREQAPAAAARGDDGNEHGEGDVEPADRERSRDVRAHPRECPDREVGAAHRQRERAAGGGPGEGQRDRGAVEVGPAQRTGSRAAATTRTRPKIARSRQRLTGATPRAAGEEQRRSASTSPPLPRKNVPTTWTAPITTAPAHTVSGERSRPATRRRSPSAPAARRPWRRWAAGPRPAARRARRARRPTAKARVRTRRGVDADQLSAVGCGGGGAQGRPGERAADHPGARRRRSPRPPPR